MQWKRAEHTDGNNLQKGIMNRLEARLQVWTMKYNQLGNAFLNAIPLPYQNMSQFLCTAFRTKRTEEAEQKDHQRNGCTIGIRHLANAQLCQLSAVLPSIFDSVLVANLCHDWCSRFSATALTPTYRQEIIQGCWWHVRWMIHEFQFGAHQNGLQDWGIVRWEQHQQWYASVQRARLMTMLPSLDGVH